MRQWTTAKRENPDALLFFRMGDFYELFYDDAVTASRELQLTLTARDRERQVPMCGVPYHSVETYLTRLLAKLDARDRVQLVIIAYETGLVPAPGST